MEVDNRFWFRYLHRSDFKKYGRDTTKYEWFYWDIPHGKVTEKILTQTYDHILIKLTM